jgi:thymidine kinase
MSTELHLESHRNPPRGSIEVITGPMFCGKTDEMIRRLRRAEIAKQKVQVFKPIIDNRYNVNKIVSHAGTDFPAIPIYKAKEILDNLKPGTTIVAVDEAQFFDSEIVQVVEQLASGDIRVIITGLSTDFRNEVFGSMPNLLAVAEDVDKLTAICMVCGEDATRTQRVINGQPAKYDDPVVLVGAEESYEARCALHHEVIGKPQAGSGAKNCKG